MLQDEINKLKKKKDVIILAHNYQLPEVQDVADMIGDSLKLAQYASRVKNKIILFCGVHFMAETAAIINPKKKVLIPDLEAGCSLSNSITIDELKTWKKKHPDAITVGYINTTAEIKTELDYCCTSSNAINIVNSIPKDREILFLPDMFLGSYIAKLTHRQNMFIWAGECHVHAGIRSKDISQKLNQLSNSELLIHPECSCTTPILYDLSAGDYDDHEVKVLSTEGMMNRAKNSTSKQFVVATETGILYKLRKQNPNKTFIPASKNAECQYMKMITAEKVYKSLMEEEYEVKISPDISNKARLPIIRMLSMK
ncbi:MAG: quinolinate synthase NadA [Thaumarchaeota archaeon]|nr:quinolinate synthase NadA [Nitrososphaerota archaeon]